MSPRATDKTEQAQALTFVEAIIPIACLIVLVGLSFYLFGDAGAEGPNQVALVVATMIGVFVGRLRDLQHCEPADNGWVCFPKHAHAAHAREVGATFRARIGTCSCRQWLR